MTKGIVVIDINPCNKCEYGLHQDININYCKIKENHCYHDDLIPDWCPITPLPEKILYKSRHSISDELFAVGWNACIDNIRGE